MPAEVDGIEIGDHLASLSGIEINYPVEIVERDHWPNQHLTSMANEMLEQAYDNALTELEEMKRKLA